ncbi:efflux RND transporter permease subunit [Coralloluteibacterium stylophorae]|uniref:Efflux RND transporter permease subunit n=1 Tax=Coralloluteibacterium stylophorae TaxID=1776034 RepID=A0AAP2FZ58_9GAMM|nr:efflux RND transporter permease subunit [Coralloluteibacterium stylophorae]MBS7455988.1 efflux RND transporter permease subunit [Coralloluteibacterium stylophorae]
MNFIEASTRRRVTVAMATLTVVLFGLIALRDIKVNLLPDLSYPTLTVRTEYTGAAPAEIETLITEPVEESVGVVKNLRKLRSISRTGQSDVVLEFAWGTDMDRAGLEVRDKLETLDLPQEATAPVLLRFNPSNEPIARLVLSAKEGESANADGALTRLRRYADEELTKRLEPVEGVAAIKVSGGLEDEVQVLIDQQRLAQLDIPIETVIERLRQENINASGGRLESGSQRFLVRTVNQFASLEQIGDMMVTTRAQGGGNSAAQEAAAAAARVAAMTGSADALAAAATASSAASGDGASSPGGGLAVRLRDIATIQQGHKEREAIIRLGGEEAVELAVYKEGDANTVTVADAMHAALERVRADLPPDAELTVVEDQSIFIRQALADVRFDALLGGVLAILIIFFFLRDSWSTFVISLSLPVSIVATFFFMQQLGLSLNVMSLGGLALATGLVVDDSIVVLESIAKARERGLGVLAAAIEGAREVSMAVVASTLTIVAVFLPLVFVEGVAGQLFKDQALTVSIAIMVSLAVSLTLVPMLSSLKGRAPMAFPEEPARAPWHPRSRVLKPVAATRRGIGHGVRGAAFGIGWLAVTAFRAAGRVVGRALRFIGTWVMKPYDRAAAGYARLLPRAMARPRLTLGTAAAVFVAAMALVPLLGLDLIPQLAQDRFEMTVKLPAGTRLEETDALMRAVQARHAEDPGIHALYGVSGSGTRLDASPTESGDNIGKLSVVLARGAPGDTEETETERLRATMAGYPQAEVKFGRPELFSFSKPLEIELRGRDLDALQVAGQRLAAMLGENDRFADVESSVQDGFPEIQIRFDQDRAAALGLTTRQIADIVVRNVRGEVATRYSFRDRKIDVLVRAQEDDRASVADIRNLIVNPQSSRPVTLESVAEVETTTGPSEIHRADQVRVAVVSANLRYGDLGSAVAAVQAMVAENPLPAGVGLHVGGQGEELQDSVNSLLFAFALAIFLVYLVMASQFESLLHPFVILFTVPLALVGAVLALVLTGSTLSVVVFIGLILLVGIVVKNAIILIDKVNQLRETGVAKYEAIIEGATSRLRPIAMTTLTALFGFMPLALATGEGAEIRAPMAITIIGGLAVSTLLTLLVIPVMYGLLDRRPDAHYVRRAQPVARADDALDGGLGEGAQA